MLKRSCSLSTLTVVILAGLPSLYAQQNELRPLANGLSEDIASAGKKSIAVVDFVDLQGNTSELGRFLAEEFSVALVRTHKGFEVVERNHLKAVLAEHKLTATGLIDPTTAQKIGQFTGADAIVTGIMTPFSESVRVAVKVLATDTARIIAADDTDLPKTQTIAELLANSIGTNPATGRGGDRPQSARLGSLRLNENPAPVRPAVSPSSDSTSPSSPVVVAQDFMYQLVECRGLASSVSCSFRITNRGSDRRLIHRCGDSGSRAFDNYGNQSPAENCTIANQTEDSSSLRIVAAEVVAAVAVQASMRFSNISAAATSLSLVNISGVFDSYPFKSSGGPRGEFNIAFRNVPILR